MNEQLHLVVVRNPFDRRERDERLLPLTAGATVADIVAAQLPVCAEINVAIDGELITREEWESRTLKPGEQMVAMPAVHDGDVLGSVMMIAVAIAAGPIGNAIAGSMGLGTAFTIGGQAITWGSIIGAGVGILGSMVLGGLMAPQKPSLPGRQSYDTSPAYSWAPATTQEPGGAVARAYGLHKLRGNIIAGYIEVQGSTGQQQIAHLLVDLGTGPYNRLYDFQLNDQPINYFNGVTVTARLGNINQDTIPAFNDTVATHPIGAKVVNGSPVVRDTAGSGYDALEIVLTCPSGLWYANDAGGLNEVSVNARIEISADAGATWATVTVTPHTVVAVAPGYWSLGEWVQRWEGGYSDWFEAQIGSSDQTAHIEGELEAEPYTLPRKSWRWIAKPTEVATVVDDYLTLSGATQQPVRRTVRVDHLTRGTQYRVRVTNLSADQTSSRYGDDLYLAELNEVMYDDFQYPRTVLAGVDALATNQISGSINFSCMAEGAIVRVWNGSAWSSAWSRNPAWVCWDILTQPVLDNSLAVVRYDGLDPSRLDLASFYAWAQFCDATVPDGKGGTEPRCLFDAVFDTPASMWEAALEVCASARAQLVMRGTTISVVVDTVRSAPAQLFNVGNTAVSSFNETWLKMEGRAASIEGSFINAEKGYERDTLTVVNTAITESAAERAQMGLRGATRASQVWREAFYRLKRNELLQRSASIGVDIDALACTVGDLIWLQNDVTRWGVGGRAASGSTTARLELDVPVTLDAGKTYELKLRLSDDTLLSRTITTAAGTVTAVDVSVAFPSAPSLYDTWAIGETGKAVKEFLVLDIRRDGEQRAKLDLVEYNATLYGIDGGIPALPTPNVSPSALPTISGFTVEEALQRATDGTIMVHLDFHFTLSAAEKAAFYRNGTVIGESATGVFRIANVTDGETYSITCAPVNALGVSPVSSWQTITHTVIGKSAPPPNITDLAIAGGTLAWTPVDAAVPVPDLAGYLFRYQVGNNLDWGTAVALHAGIITSSPFTPELLPFGLVSIMGKAVDTSGNESLATCNIIAGLGDAPIANVIETIDFDALAYPGTLSGCTLSGGDLIANVTDSLYGTDAQSFYGIDGDPFYGASSYAQMSYTTGEIVPVLALAGSLMTLEINVQGMDQRIEWRKSAPGSAYGADVDSFYGADGDPFYSAPSAWAGWPGQLAATVDSYELRTTIGAGAQQGRISAMRLVIDAPDMTEEISDLAIAATATAIPHTKPFTAIKSVQATLQANGSGAVTVEVNKTAPLAPTILAYNAAHSAVAGATADITLRGY